MLKEEQVEELLAKHKSKIEKKLDMIRGNLRNAETRAAQVWELVVLDAAAHIGEVEYESYRGASPDIKLHLPKGRPIWIEVAYLYPRFWQERREMNTAVRWIFSEAKRLGIEPSKIFPRFEAHTRTAAGPSLTLPDQHKKNEFLHDPELTRFFEHIKANPDLKHVSSLSGYSISIEYQPHAMGSFVSWSAIEQEGPTAINEHALYRVLNDKADQHKVSGQRVVCVGTDVSPAMKNLRSPGVISVRDVITAIFSRRRSLSAVIIVDIETIMKTSYGFQRRARKQIFINPSARSPLTSEESSYLETIDFNHWRYTFSLPKKEPADGPKNGRLGGVLVCMQGRMGCIVEVPDYIVVECLAGKASLEDFYRLDENESLLRMFKEGWKVVSCSFKEGNLEDGESPKIVFEIVPVDSVFWPHKSGGKMKRGSQGQPSN